jgi:hypothetical protein
VKDGRVGVGGDPVDEASARIFSSIRWCHWPGGSLVQPVAVRLGHVYGHGGVSVCDADEPGVRCDPLSPIEDLHGVRDPYQGGHLGRHLWSARQRGSVRRWVDEHDATGKLLDNYVSLGVVQLVTRAGVVAVRAPSSGT